MAAICGHGTGVIVARRICCCRRGRGRGVVWIGGCRFLESCRGCRLDWRVLVFGTLSWLLSVYSQGIDRLLSSSFGDSSSVKFVRGNQLCFLGVSSFGATVPTTLAMGKDVPSNLVAGGIGTHGWMVRKKKKRKKKMKKRKKKNKKKRKREGGKQECDGNDNEDNKCRPRRRKGRRKGVNGVGGDM
ncbi:hypothetical protein FNV43_RR22664 [Rhamnella rubrinervis]|uniref:Uncharacterized protein n=1 Tax=Rhamnella rubrinervis TaxID=2594499 RepID=A0A8K0DQV8_9ROSA|nr:hypothetical protein FNV43_RR22664 [Rhamnella rubrinervis]